MTLHSLRATSLIIVLALLADDGHAQPPQPPEGRPAPTGTDSGRPGQGGRQPGGPRQGGPGQGGPRTGGPGFGGPGMGAPGMGGPGGRMRGGPGGPGGPGGQAAADPAAAVTRMFTLDTNKDGKLSKDEVTDKRLLALGERADANKDGNVTREELTALFTKEAAEANAGRMQGGPGGGPGGPR